jgi:hypothetical protein
LILRSFYNDCGVVRSKGNVDGNSESGGCDLFCSCNENGGNSCYVLELGLRIGLFKFMGYLICVGG